MAWTVLTALMLLLPAGADALTRNHAARAEFVRRNPCPSTGATQGPCPGWQVDHVIPLKCNGLDRPENMQWLTVEQHKAKTASEAKACRSKKDQKP